MVSGITSGWGYSIQNVGNLTNRREIENHPLTNEEALTSYPPTFKNKMLISPLTSANKSYYTKFGKKLKYKNKQIRYDLKYLINLKI